MTIELKENERLDDLQRNGLQIIQKTDGFCFGMDAVLLSGFTQDGQGLLVGTNLGGLGTLIASLASLISFRYYLRLEGAKPLRYLGVFTGLNLAGLAVLTSLALCLSLW